MQLASVTPLAPSILPSAPIVADVAPPSWPTPHVATPRPAAAAAPAPLSGSIDGVAQLFAPIIDFPGIAAGQVFDIAKGSKVGFFGVKGQATITRFDDEGATFAVKAGALGVKVDVVVDVLRTGAQTVRITSRGSGIPDTTVEGRVVESRTDYAEFERTDVPAERTIIRHDGRGGIVIDTVVPSLGAAHLVLARR